jgi:hypothetical protein
MRPILLLKAPMRKHLREVREDGRTGLASPCPAFPGRAATAQKPAGRASSQVDETLYKWIWSDGRRAPMNEPDSCTSTPGRHVPGTSAE